MSQYLNLHVLSVPNIEISRVVEIYPKEKKHIPILYS